MDYKIKCAIIADPDKVGNKLNAIEPATSVLLHFINKHPELAELKVSERSGRTFMQFVKELQANVYDFVEYMNDCQIAGHDKIEQFINQTTEE